MSQIPRRTSEFQPGSARKGSRLTANLNVRPSTSAAALRTTSRVSQTPLRTPARTPQRSTSSSRKTFLPMTAEKEKAPVDDREQIQARSVKILNELAEVGGYNDLVQKGFKSMTTRQFSSILEHFLKPIIGKCPDDFHTMYVESVPPILQSLDYPYNISKSTLKTPSALHCLNSNILLLSWLQDFFLIEDETTLYQLSEELPTAEIASQTVKKFAEQFVTWNSAQIEMDQALERIGEAYLELHPEADANLTTETERLQEEIRQLKKAIKPHNLNEELNHKNQEYNNLEQKVAMHNENIGELTRKKENAYAELNVKRNAQKTIQDKINRLHAQLSRQKLTVEVRHQLLVEITQMKSALSSKKNAVMELSEASSKNEILLSNLISKKVQYIDHLNNMIYKLSSDLEIAGMNDTFDPENYVIHPTKDDKSFEKMLENLKQGMKSLKEKYLKALSSVKEESIKKESECHQLKTQSELLQSKCAQRKAICEQLCTDENNLELELNAFLHNTQAEEQTHLERMLDLEKEIEERTKAIEQIKIDVEDAKEKKSSFAKKSVDECKKLYEIRKKEIDDRRKEIEENNAIIEDYFKNREPLPENLQKLADDMLKKYDEKMKNSNEQS